MIHIEVDCNPQTQELTLKSNAGPEVSLTVLHQAYVKALLDTLLAAVAAQAAQQRRIIDPRIN